MQAKEAELFQQIRRLQMELEWLKKTFSCSEAHELLKLVDHDHPELNVSRQYVLLGLPRSTLYYRPVPVHESMLQLMARIDALYLDDPCRGSRRMVAYLARPRFTISRDRGRKVQHLINFQAIYKTLRTKIRRNPTLESPKVIDVIKIIILDFPWPWRRLKLQHVIYNRIDIKFCFHAPKLYWEVYADKKTTTPT